MMMNTLKRHSFKDISWEVDEPTYREDSALSYSMLARFDREGFNGLDKLFLKVDTPSLTFGSAVDSLLTGGKEEFDLRFIVATFPTLPDSIISILKPLYQNFKTQYRSLKQVPDSTIIEATEVLKYQLNWKPETRVKVIKEKGEEYYNLLGLADNKTIIDFATYQNILDTVYTLQHSTTTKIYFEPDNPFQPNIERFYQLKFKATFRGVLYRSMADLILVNHETKEIIPIDLKTSGHPEWDFHKSFVTWKYDIQARLYWANIRQNMDKDPYYKDFKLLDYRFIVANKNTLCPLVWKYVYSSRLEDTIVLGRTGNIVFRSPLDIGDELNHYLSTGATVPIGITKDKSNDIVEWLNKEI